MSYSRRVLNSNDTRFQWGLNLVNIRFKLSKISTYKVWGSNIQRTKHNGKYKRVSVPYDGMVHVRSTHPCRNAFVCAVSVVLIYLFSDFSFFPRCRLFFPLSVISYDNNTSSSTNKLCGTYRSVCFTGNTEKILFVELRKKKYIFSKNILWPKIILDQKKIFCRCFFSSSSFFFLVVPFSSDFFTPVIYTLGDDVMSFSSSVLVGGRRFRFVGVYMPPLEDDFWWKYLLDVSVSVPFIYFTTLGDNDIH